MGNSKTCRGLQVSKVQDMQPPALRPPHLPAEGGQDDGAFDDRLAALKAAKKQAPYGSSRKDGKDKDGAPKQGEKRCTCTSQISVAATSLLVPLLKAAPALYLSHCCLHCRLA